MLRRARGSILSAKSLPTRSVLYATLASALVVRVGGTYLFAVTLGYGLVGVWMGSTLDWVVRSVWLGAVYARGRWRSVAIQD